MKEAMKYFTGIAYLVPFWLYFDQIILTIDYLMIFFVGILHFASCPNLKMDTKEALYASAFGRMEPFSLLTYFD